MKNLLLKLKIVALLFLSYLNASGQCTGCVLTITAPSSASYSLTANTTVCITGSGSFTGQLNNFNGNTLCIGTGVTYNPSSTPNYNGNWTIINNGTFQNVNNLNFNSGCNFTNAATGTISLGSVNIGCPFVNNGILNASSLTANTSITLGGTTTISGALNNNATLTITGTVLAGSINNNNSIIGGSSSNCNSIKATGSFTNSGTIGNTGQYLYVGNTGGSILSPATTVSPTAPPSQPTSLILTNTGSIVNGSFTQCTSSGYVILRAIAATVPTTTNPTNMNSLSVGQTVGAWTVAAINSGQTSTTFSDNVGTTCSNIYYRIYSFNNSGNCRVYNTSSALTGTYNFTPAITGTTPASRCGAGSVALVATPSVGTINWYAAATGGASLGSGNSFTTPSIASTTTYYVDATNNGCINTPRTAVVATINTIPTITSTTPASRCSSGTLTLGAASSAGTINWYAAATGGASLSTGTSFTTPSIAVTTVYYVDATNGSCTTTSRTAITATVNPNLAASVTIATAMTTICNGTTAVFTATPTNGGTTPTYQWKINGTNVAGQTSATFSTTTLANNDAVTVVMTSNATPCLTGSPATSNSIIITVVPPSAVGTASASQTICSGTLPASLTLSSNIGNIQWQSSTDNITFSNIIGATSSTLQNTTIGSLLTTTYYRAVVTNNVCPSITSNTVTINISNYPGNFGNALNLDGTNDYFVTPNIGAAMPTSDVTVELWFKANTAGVLATELGQATINTGWHDSQIEILSTGEVKVRVWPLASVSLGFVSFGTWNHAAIRYSSSTSKLDGVLNGIASTGSTVGARSKSTSSGYGYHYAFGATDATNLGGGAYFNGDIDEVRIWNTARTNTQIQTFMNTELLGNESGLVIYYNSNQGTANGTNTGLTTLYDKTSNSLNGSINNFALTGTTSNYIGAYTFSIAPITGVTTACTGSTSQLNDTTLGGVWSSSNTAVATVNSTGLVTALSFGTTTITYTITSNVGCSSSVSVTFTVGTLPAINSTSPASRCDTGTVTLSATATSGTINWYSALTGGTSIASGNSFTTPSLSTTTTYYIDSNNNGCATSPRTAIQAAVYTTTLTSTTPGSRTGAGTVTLGATVSSGTINWYTALTGGSPIATGASFTTPIISITTTYYVEVVNGICTSSTRTPVVATVKYPEIDVQGNAISIVNGDTSPSALDWTDFGTTNLSRTFTIYNTGNASLNIGNITISGANANAFSVTAAPNTTITIGSSTTFTVTFDPSTVGLNIATINFNSNDQDENPFSFTVQGTGLEQEIDVQGNLTSIVNGDTTPNISDWTDFSDTAGTRTFTISNLGNIVLNIGALTINGLNAADFVIISPPSETVAAYGSTTFTVAFNPSALNTRTASISIINDDNTENPYSFTIQGLGINPEIEVQGNSVSIIDDTSSAATTTNGTDFSNTTANQIFTIYNNGNMPLTLGAITFTGANASEFTISSAPSSTITAFSSTTFTVNFSPTALGIRYAQIHIVTNDSDENPYDFNLQGTGIDKEIDLQGNGLSIVSGDTVASINDGTDFGPTDVNLATITRTFTILNTGSIPLTISNPTVSGINASEFTISTPPGTLTIGSNLSTTFQVTFNPSAVFTRVATINIVNNDSNENPYTFTIQGTGLLDNDGDGIENNADQDDDNDGIIDFTECGTCVSDPFVNGSFETPAIAASSYSIKPSAVVTGWTNSAENFIEIWSSGFNGVPAAAGNQFVELNANLPGTLYQTFCLNGAGGTINWSLKHRGRSGTDVAAVKFGPTLATVTTIATMTDGNTAWGSYSGTYSIPIGQTNIILAFSAISSSGGLSYGNFIDDIQIVIVQNCIDSDSDGVADITDIDSDNDGIPDIEEAGFKAYSSGKSTMDLTSSTTWIDANSNGINDYIESLINAGTYQIPDKDGDGLKNHLDLDSDNDSLFDVNEANLLNGDGDINDDGKGDGADSDGDGLLNLYDNSNNFGTNTRPYAQDTDANGTPDYLDLDANDDGTADIQTGLYGNLDTNGDGVIDGSGDADGDGITDTFDTNNTIKGSPRDLSRKLYLDFDGRNDYAEDSSILGGLSNATLMAWIDLNNGFNTTGVVIGQYKFQIKVISNRKLQATVNGVTITYNIALNKSQWYHVAATYGDGSLTLYLNGKIVATQALTGNIAADPTKLTLGKNPLSNSNFFKGKIDEVRVFNATLTATQVERMVYQEIQNVGSQVQGSIVPKEIGSLPFTTLLRYYKMDTYKDDIVDDLTTPTTDTGTGMKLYNHKVINVQQAPMPFTTLRSGSFATAIEDTTKDIRGLDVLSYDYSIIQVKHNITETANCSHLAMFVDPGITINMTNDTKLENDWYLKLDGKIDLVGKSQLIQTSNSDLDITSAGSIERDQQGQSNKYNYNYWSSPVSTINNVSINNGYTVAGVMKDGTDPNNIQNIQWSDGADSAATTPITLSNYWIFKFQNSSNNYANWAAVGSTGALLAGQGYTLKGSNAATGNQNYTFVGKPNNGTITSTVAADNLNLCGNPYASAIDADQFINDNSASITGTLYFWEHYSSNSSHNTIEYQGGYATRTLVGGTPPVAPAGISGLGSSSKTPSRFIPVGQGFFVKGSTTGGTITFNNGQRLFIKEDNANSNTMFKSANKTVNATFNAAFNNSEDSFTQEEFAKIRLGFNTIDNNHRQILLGFMNQYATAGIDPKYDAEQIEIHPNDMYFINGNNNLNINGEGYFNATNIYPLGVKTATDGNVTFVLDGKENFDENQEIYIFDNNTNIYHSIKSDNFQINLPAGTYEGRFSLRFSNGLLGIDENQINNGISIIHSQSNAMINIKNQSQHTISSVVLFNIVGQNISTWNVQNNNQENLELPVSNLTSGTYIVKVITEKGAVTKKIIVK